MIPQPLFLTYDLPTYKSQPYSKPKIPEIGTSLCVNRYPYVIIDGEERVGYGLTGLRFIFTIHKNPFSKLRIRSTTPLSSVVFRLVGPSFLEVPDWDLMSANRLDITVQLELERAIPSAPYTIYFYSADISEYVGKFLEWSYTTAYDFFAFEEDIADWEAFKRYLCVYFGEHIGIHDAVTLPWSENALQDFVMQAQYYQNYSSVSWNRSVYAQQLYGTFNGHTLAEQLIKGTDTVYLGYCGIHGNTTKKYFLDSELRRNMVAKFAYEFQVNKYMVNKPVVWHIGVFRSTYEGYVFWRYRWLYDHDPNNYREFKIRIVRLTQSDQEYLAQLTDSYARFDYIVSKTIYAVDAPEHEPVYVTYTITPTLDDLAEGVFYCCFYTSIYQPHQHPVKFYSFYSMTFIDFEYYPQGLPMPVSDGQHILFPLQQDPDREFTEEIVPQYEASYTTTPPVTAWPSFLVNKKAKIVLEPPAINEAQQEIKIFKCMPASIKIQESYIREQFHFGVPISPVGSGLTNAKYFIYTRQLDQPCIFPLTLTSTSSIMIEEVNSIDLGTAGVVFNNVYYPLQYQYYIVYPGNQPDPMMMMSRYRRIKTEPFSLNEILAFLRHPTRKKHRKQIFKRHPTQQITYYYVTLL